MFLTKSIKLVKTLGRKKQLITAALLYLFGGVITAYAPELGVLLAGRLIYGWVSVPQFFLIVWIYFIFNC